jgi:DNA-binding PadR family transcriptional regulator
MKETINNKETAILGLLSEKPMHGYDIEQAIRMRDMRYWTEISMSSVYKVLKKLEEKKLVVAEIRMATNNVAQKVYTLTPAGSLALKDKVAALFTAFDHHQWDIDLAISNFGILPDPLKKECIEAYITKLEELFKGYGELEKYLTDEECPGYRLALATRPQYLYRAELEWARDYLHQFNTKQP